MQMDYMKLGKASGPLGLLQKVGGDKCLKSLTNISNILFKDKLLVQGMLRSLVPIFTGKGNPLNPNSYRGIKLLKHAFKLHNKILDRHLQKVVDIDKMWYGFVSKRGTVDAVFEI